MYAVDAKTFTEAVASVASLVATPLSNWYVQTVHE